MKRIDIQRLIYLNGFDWSLVSTVSGRVWSQALTLRGWLYSKSHQIRVEIHRRIEYEKGK